MQKESDVVIIGGGAAGLVCAIEAKRQDRSKTVAIIEKNDRVGKKLLATGNGRCNLTNTRINGDVRQYYTGSFAGQTASLLRRLNADWLRRYFAALGLLTRSDSEGRCYPLSNHASSVLDVLRFGCERYGVEFICGEQPHSVKKAGELFRIKTAHNEFAARKLVIACGSKASPKLGGSAGGLDMARNFGHRIIPFSPALCPVPVSSGLLRSLKGIRAAAAVTLTAQDNRFLPKTESGEIQFTENALSGICVFNLSLFARPGDILVVDLLSDYPEQQVFEIIAENKKRFSKLTADNLLTGILQKRLAQAVMKQAGVSDFSVPCGSLLPGQIEAIVRTVKHMSFSAEKITAFEQAQCASGGVAGSEINEKTMESKKVKNLYLCGEVIDSCGICGGFNLHFAFASGYLAGGSL